MPELMRPRKLGIRIALLLGQKPKFAGPDFLTSQSFDVPNFLVVGLQGFHHFQRVQCRRHHSLGNYLPPFGAYPIS